MKLFSILFSLAVIIACNSKKQNILEREQIEITVPNNMFPSIKKSNEFVLTEVYTKPTPKPMTTFGIESFKNFNDLKTFSNHYETVLLPRQGELNLISKKDTTFKGFSATTFLGTIKVQKWDFKFRSIFFVKDSKILRLENVSQLDEFEKQKQLTNPIFESFKIKN